MLFYLLLFFSLHVVQERHSQLVQVGKLYHIWVVGLSVMQSLSHIVQKQVCDDCQLLMTSQKHLSLFSPCRQHQRYVECSLPLAVLKSLFLRLLVRYGCCADASHRCTHTLVCVLVVVGNTFTLSVYSFTNRGGHSCNMYYVETSGFIIGSLHVCGQLPLTHLDSVCMCAYTV